MTDSTTEPQPSPAYVPDPPPLPGIPQHDRFTSLFLGPEGLRPGWGLLLYLLLFRLLIQVAVVVLRPTVHRLGHTVWKDLVNIVVPAVSIMLATWIMSRVERRPFGVYGLPWREVFGRNFAWGLLWGFTALSALLISLRGLHAFYFGVLAEHGERALKFALFWAFVFFLVGIFEEGLFRGYAQFTLARGLGFWPAAALLSILFAAAHLQNPGERPLGILMVACMGLFWCFTLRRTGSVWFAVGLHASWDWGQSYFYGVPDSGSTSAGHLLSPSWQGPAWLTGGSVGPEGSVLVLGVISAMFVVFHFSFPAKDADGASFSQNV